MNFSIPYFRNRRYLTGTDWVVAALHEASKKSVGAGAVSQAVLELQGALDETKLRAALDQVSKRFPLIHGKIGRDWCNLAPYWKVPRSARTASIPLRVVDVPEDDLEKADQLLADHVNTPFESETDHLRFLLVRMGPQRCKLGLMFDHRLFDAFGAEATFRLLDEAFQGRLEESAARVKITEPAHLDHWPRRFASGRTLNRLLMKLQEQDICAIALPKITNGRRICFVHECLTVEQTARINQKAFAEIGMPIILPSAAARAVAAMRQVIPLPALAGKHYLLFTSANMRPPGQEWETMFFNHLSFLQFSAPYEDKPVGIPEMAVTLRDQLFQHMKDKIPFAMEDAAALGRIFPRSLVARTINSMFKGRMCSFYFACLKESGFSGQTFLGIPTKNLIHTPTAFAPPGMNLCMTFFGNRFNLVLSYLDGALDEPTARQILQQFKSSLID